MDISSVSASRYTAHTFNPVLYEQPPQRTFHGGTLGPVTSGASFGTSPLPGSNWPSEDTVWIAQSKEASSIEKVHVSEMGQRMLSKMEGLWEVQSWSVRRLQDEQNSLERMTIASRFMTQNAINTMISLKSGLDVAGHRIDIYA
ncbi:MAG TPA: hypothetical protein VM123_16075 [archaeon]|nr:hypothetical protein [archaeon]